MLTLLVRMYISDEMGTSDLGLSVSYFPFFDVEVTSFIPSLFFVNKARHAVAENKLRQYVCKFAKR